MTSSTITSPSSRSRCLRMLGSDRVLVNPMAVLEQLVDEVDRRVEELSGQPPALARAGAGDVRQPTGVLEHPETEEQHDDGEHALLGVHLNSPSSVWCGQGAARTNCCRVFSNKDRKSTRLNSSH